MMKARINNHLAEEDRQEIVGSLVRRALLDGSGDLTIEFKVPPPEMSFGFSLSCSTPDSSLHFSPGSSIISGTE